MTLCGSSSLFAQKTFDGKKLKEVKEWSIEGSKKKLDHKTIYDANGKKQNQKEIGGKQNENY
jgi:hypothetical protein